MTHEQELKNMINNIKSNGGCSLCRYSYGTWNLCSDCIIKMENIKAELKGISIGKAQALDEIRKAFLEGEKRGIAEGKAQRNREIMDRVEDILSSKEECYSRYRLLELRQLLFEFSQEIKSW